MAPRRAHSASDGLTFKAYRGDGAVLLAFDVDEGLRPDLAGFALEYTTPQGDTHPVYNRLNFADAVTAETTPAERQQISTKTVEAPLQKFHWVHFPAEVTPGQFTYRATAMLFQKDSEDRLEPGPTTELQIDLVEDHYPKFSLGFTRGYLSSQAYAARFKNKPIAPHHPTIDFDTGEFEERWAWLGFNARKLIFDFLDEAVSDDKAELDVFAYDLNEPDVIRRLRDLGPRLRLFLDSSDEHAKPRKGGALPLELEAKAALERSAGADHVKVGDFGRFAHSKVFILKRAGVAEKVLAGSANFSVRGLYVQSNNVFVFDDQETAGRYEQAFTQAWQNPSTAAFANSEIAAGWFDQPGGDLPPRSLCFSPHTKATVSLERVAEAIAGAKSSVLFAIMDIGSGSGPVLDQIRALKGRDLYAFGTTQRLNGALKVTKPEADSPFIPFAYLKSKVAEPFLPEFAGGSGQVIHHKFVVVDFNHENPIAFGGSSNLAGGGEEENGDNLVAFSDPGVATTYAVEAIQLIDHYRFRAVQEAATKQEPLRLKTRSEDWSRDYFDPKKPKFRERELFVG